METLNKGIQSLRDQFAQDQHDKGRHKDYHDDGDDVTGPTQPGPQ